MVLKSCDELKESTLRMLNKFKDAVDVEIGGKTFTDVASDTFMKSA